jgi:hypothetical protein
VVEFNAEERRQISLARKEAHPDWPTHRVSMVYPNGHTELICESVPISKWGKIGYCKYCYSNHCDWWLMDDLDFDPPEGEVTLLCGRCEHASLSE